MAADLEIVLEKCRASGVPSSGFACLDRLLGTAGLSPAAAHRKFDMHSQNGGSSMRRASYGIRAAEMIAFASST